MHELLEPQDFKKILLHSSHSSTLSEVKSKVLRFMKILETRQIVLEFIATTSALLTMSKLFFLSTCRHFFFSFEKYFVNLKSIHNKLVRFYVKLLKFNFSLWYQSSPMKYWWIAPYLFRLQTISYLQIDSRRPHVKHFLKNHDLSVFDLNLTMSGECVFDKDLFLMHS